MIESSMYLGIGVLLGALIGLVLIPVVYGRAVRLTTRRLQAVLPETMAEIYAEKDLLRAEFAISTRRLEIAVVVTKACVCNYSLREPFFCCRFRSRTPGPPPFSSMNSTPADSNARRIAKSLALVSAVRFSFNSARRMVATLSADAAARSSVVQCIRDRAALI
jgi:hypothetical protein